MYPRVEMTSQRSTAVVDKLIKDNNVENNVILEVSQQAKVNNTRTPAQSDLKLTKIINNIDLRLNEAKKSKTNKNYMKYEMNEQIIRIQLRK